MAISSPSLPSPSLAASPARRGEQDSALRLLNKVPVFVVLIFLIDPAVPDPASAVTALVADLTRQLPLGRPALLGRLPQALPGGRLLVPLLGEIPERCSML